MIAFPNAKINLGLNVVSRRKDGYHDIESCFYPIPWHDALEMVEAASFSFHAYGLDIPGTEESNLCVKAYKLLKSAHDIPPVAIHLLKQIPMGAGLGGGSADGAYTLKLINQLFALNLTHETLEKYALQLGSDCPFFIKNQPTLASGRGEALKEINLDLSGYLLAIHNPGIHIPTRDAYRGITPEQPTLTVKEILTKPVKNWKDALFNDFEKSIFMHHPQIQSIKEEMYSFGALYASMTGSGSTVFGIFKSKPANPKWKILSL